MILEALTGLVFIGFGLGIGMGLVVALALVGYLAVERWVEGRRS